MKSFPHTVDTFRASWEKTDNPILRLLTFPERGWLKVRKDIQIEVDPISTEKRGKDENEEIETVEGRLYYNGENIKLCTELILDVPGIQLEN